MQFHGKEIPFSLMNAATADRFEEALAKMQSDTASATENPRLGEIIRRQISITRGFIEGVLGEDVYAQLALDPNELEPHLDLVEAIVDDADRQSQRIRERTARYSPERGARP